jgi:hypothetical protein
LPIETGVPHDRLSAAKAIVGFVSTGGRRLLGAAKAHDLPIVSQPFGCVLHEKAFGWKLTFAGNFHPATFLRLLFHRQ